MYRLPEDYEIDNRFDQFKLSALVSSLGPAPFVELRVIGDLIEILPVSVSASPGPSN